MISTQMKYTKNPRKAKNLADFSQWVILLGKESEKI